MPVQRLFQICFILSLYGGLTSATEVNNRSKRSASKTVDIAMFTDSSPPGKRFSVYVDDTMSRLYIEVKVDRSNPVIIVSKPSGPGPFPKLNGTASTGTITATIDVDLTVADYRIWHLTKLDANTWNVKVQGESPLDFSYQFLEGSLIQMPITEDPIQGETYTTRISVQEYATIQKVDMFLEFVTEKSSPINMLPPNGKNGTFDVASIKMLDKDFMIGIQGRDKSGNFFRRIAVIKPIAWILSVPIFSAGVKWYENSKLDILFFVINKLKIDQDIDVKIQDTQGLAEAPKIIFLTLTAGQNYSGHFVLRGGLPGVTTKVTITVSQYLGHGQIKQGPSAVKQFTVEGNQTGSMRTNFIDIARFTDSSAPAKEFSIFVDDTITRLFIEIKVDGSNPVVIVSKPSGLHVGSRPNLNGTASTGTVTFDVSITAADYGVWKLTKLDTNTWNVKVQGESTLDFTYQFLQGSFIQTFVQGDPIQGETYKVVITVPAYATIQTVDMALMFVTERNAPENMLFPINKGAGMYEVSSLKMLGKEFMIGIQGKDNSGHFFRRITVIKPIALILSVPPYTGLELFENAKLDIPFSVLNMLSIDQDIEVRIQDTKDLAEASRNISVTLKPGQNFTGKFVIRGGLIGVTTNVTITAYRFLENGQLSHGTSEVRQLTVERHTTSTSTSTTTILPTAITFTTNGVSSSGSTLSTVVKSSTSSIAGIATSSKTSLTSAKSLSSRTVAGYTSTTLPLASFKLGHPVSSAMTMTSTESPTNTKAIAPTTTATTTASTISSSDKSLMSSFMMKQSPTLSVTSYPSAKTTSTKLSTDEDNKGDFFAIISAVVIKNGMKTGQPSSELKKKYMTFSEHIEIAWP